MKRLTALLLALVLALLAAACGRGGTQENGGEESGNVLPENTVVQPLPEPEPEPEPVREPYEILDPTVMPEGGQRDGVTYAAYDGIVEHLFFHPVIAYPELAFDGDAQEKGLDDYMVTVDEFNRILQSVYDPLWFPFSEAMVLLSFPPVRSVS